jgi:hypothetical protein
VIVHVKCRPSGPYSPSYAIESERPGFRAKSGIIDVTDQAGQDCNCIHRMFPTFQIFLDRFQ